MVDPLLAEALARLDRRLVAACDAEERRALLLQGDGGEGWDAVRNLVRPAVGELASVSRPTALVPDGSHPLNRIRKALRLEPTEVDLLLVLLAPHVEARYGAVYAVLHDDLQRPWASERVAHAILAVDGATRRALTTALAPGGRVVGAGLVRRNGDAAPLQDRLSLAPELVAPLLGGDAISVPGAGEVRVDLGTAPGPVPERFVVHGAVDPSDGVRPYVRGPMLLVTVPDEAAAATAIGAAWRLGMALELTPVVSVAELDDRARRQVVGLLGALVAWGGRLGVFAREPLDLPVPHFAAPGVGWADRRDAWLALAAARGIALSPPDAERLAERWRHGPHAIGRILARAGPADDADRLHALAATVGHETVVHGVRVPTERTFDDLVVRDTTRAALERLVYYVRNRDRVSEAHGLQRRFRLAHGPVVLFSGTSGTGKTLAAEVVAGHLGRPLITVDLARLVSKYIGETEKNIDQVLRQGEQSGAVLFFDEADALFSARTEVSSSNDRFANLEVGYLLQRIERHDGLVILATNLRQSIDEAFLRRFQFRIEFPFPEPAERARIWETLLPPALVADLDLGTVGRSHRLSGGNIRNAAIKAIFLAEERGTPITRELLDQAIDLELLELGRLSRRGAGDPDRGTLLRALVETVQERLEDWFRERFLKEIHVLVGSPTKEALAGKQPAVSVALYRTAGGRKGGLRLGFVVSTWSGRPEEEHELLGAVIDALGAAQLAEIHGRPVRARLVESHDFDLLHRFWSSHGHPVRPSVVLDAEIDG